MDSADADWERSADSSWERAVEADSLSDLAALVESESEALADSLATRIESLWLSEALATPETDSLALADVSSEAEALSLAAKALAAADSLSDADSLADADSSTAETLWPSLSGPSARASSCPASSLVVVATLAAARLGAASSLGSAMDWESAVSCEALAFEALSAGDWEDRVGSGAAETDSEAVCEADSKLSSSLSTPSVLADSSSFAKTVLPGAARVVPMMVPVAAVNLRSALLRLLPFSSPFLFLRILIAALVSTDLLYPCTV